MNKTSMREAFEYALRTSPVGQAQTYVRRSIARNHGYQRTFHKRSARIPQVWSSPRAAKEFFGG